MNLKTISLLFFAMTLSVVSFSQKKVTKPDDLLFLLRQSGHISQALKTVNQLKVGAKASKSIHMGKVAIIICGDAVKEFAGANNNEIVTEAERLGVTLMGCGLSLNKFNLKKEDLMPGVQFVNNGFIKAFELQKEGYLSVEL